MVNLSTEKLISRSPADSRDYPLTLTASGDLPSAIDLKPDVMEIENQGQFGSCTANAGCSAMELMYNRSGLKKDFSRFFLYYFERRLGGIVGDKGANCRDIGKTLKEYGVCHESTWDYIPEHLEAQPDAAAVEEAKQYKIDSYCRLDLGQDKLKSIKTSIVNGVPVVLAIKVNNNFMNLQGKDWRDHSWDISGPVVGGHAVLIIGYDDSCGNILVENSWGPNWGDGGFFGMPYEFLNTPTTMELWSLIPKLDNMPKVKTSILSKIWLFIMQSIDSIRRFFV